MLVLACSVALVDGLCPEGSAAWVEVAEPLTGGFLTPTDINPLLGQIVVWWMCAAAARFIVRAVRS